MRAHGIIGISALSLLASPVASQPSCAEVICTAAIAITSHAVTEADYPLDSVKSLERGKVFVRFVIRETGDVDECSVMESSGYARLDEAACAVVRRWKYKPATADGKAVAQNTTANIVFQFSDFPGWFATVPPPPSDPSQLDPVFDIPDSYVPPSSTGR